VEAELILGFGGGGGLACDNNSEGCKAYGSIDIGEGVSVGSFRLELSFGLAGEYSFNEGTFIMGAEVTAANCSLFVNFANISVNCTTPYAGLATEFGWKRTPYQSYWAIVHSSVFTQMSYNEFAKRSVIPANSQNAEIRHDIVDRDKEHLSLWIRTYKKGIPFLDFR
jgi:hypothetical protein